MIGDFNIFPMILFRQLNFAGLDSSSNSYFTFIAKEKLHFSLICSFYCYLVKEAWARKFD